MLSGLAKGRIFLAPGVTDMRKSFNGLSGLVRSSIAGDPFSGYESGQSIPTVGIDAFEIWLISSAPPPKPTA